MACQLGQPGSNTFLPRKRDDLNLPEFSTLKLGWKYRWGNKRLWASFLHELFSSLGMTNVVMIAMDGTSKFPIPSLLDFFAWLHAH